MTEFLIRVRQFGFDFTEYSFRYNGIDYSLELQESFFKYYVLRGKVILTPNGFSHDWVDGIISYEEAKTLFEMFEDKNYTASDILLYIELTHSNDFAEFMKEHGIKV